MKTERFVSTIDKLTVLSCIPVKPYTVIKYIESFTKTYLIISMARFQSEFRLIESALKICIEDSAHLLKHA